MAYLISGCCAVGGLDPPAPPLLYILRSRLLGQEQSRPAVDQWQRDLSFLARGEGAAQGCRDAFRIQRRVSALCRFRSRAVPVICICSVDRVVGAYKGGPVETGCAPAARLIGANRRQVPYLIQIKLQVSRFKFHVCTAVHKPRPSAATIAVPDASQNWNVNRSSPILEQTSAGSS